MSFTASSRKPQRDRQTRRHQDQRQDDGVRDRQAAARDRPALLFRVLSVGIQVEEIVDQVNARRAERDGRERESPRREDRPVLKLVGGDDRDEDEEILHPLAHPDRLDERLRGQGNGRERLRQISILPQAVLDRGRRVHGDGAPRLLPDGKVRRPVSRVVESPVAEALHERARLRLAREVRRAVASHHLVEELEVRGHLLRPPEVGGGDEDESPAAALLPAQKFDQALVVRERRRFERHPVRDLSLETRPPPREPEGGLDQGDEPFSRKTRQRLVKEIAPDQGPVEIDTKGNAGTRGVLGLLAFHHAGSSRTKPRRQAEILCLPFTRHPPAALDFARWSSQRDRG